ncbi:MAG: hypothetical protein ACI37N_08745 [Prevotella sp.]
MKKSIILMLSELHGRLLGYFSMMSYGYCQLCVKADPSSILGFEEEEGSMVYRIEDLAEVGLHEEPENEDKLDLYPKDPSNLAILARGMMKIHPEFKQSLEKYTGTEENDESIESKYLRLTMPEVNDDRRDLINTAIDGLDTECKLKFDAMKAKYLARITKELIDDPKALDEAKEKIDELVDEADQMREKMTNDKKKEVEDAYQRYLTSHTPEEIAADRLSAGKTEEQENVAQPQQKAPENSESKPFTFVGQSLKMD